VRLTPKGHQLLEASHLLALPGKRGLLLSETGTGKTITLGLIAQRIGRPCLWLTEKSFVTQTRKELPALGLAAFHPDVPLEGRRQVLPQQKPDLANRLLDYLAERPDH
jgi:hypothetical protein